MLNFRIRLLSFLLLLAAAMPTHADDWERSMVLYFIGAGLDGRVQVGPRVADINESSLDYGGAASFVARSDELTLGLDALYIGQSGDKSAFHFDSTQLVASLDAGYFVNDWLELLGGVRYTSLEMELRVNTGAGSGNTRGDKDWVDPYVGARATIPFNDEWSLTLRADIGGFNVGSELAWQAVARVNWAVAPSLLVTLGYRVLDADYQDGSGTDAFRYDATMAGPAAGFGWRF
jgi:opacity protein-like surface antigen